MAGIAWRAQPYYFIGLHIVEIIRGLIPLIIAWIIKEIYDLIVVSMQSGFATQIYHKFFILLATYSVVTVIGHLIVYISDFLNAELGRLLTINIQPNIYKKINELQGIRPFEDPRFYDTIELAAQGAQIGPTQLLHIFTSFMSSIVTIISFMGVLISVNPFSAGLVILATLPQFYIQIRMGKQRLGLAFQKTPKERLAFYYGNVLSSVQFAKELRLFNLASFFIQKHRQLSIDIQNSERQQQKSELCWQGKLSVIADIVAMGAFTAVVIQAINGNFSIGNVALYNNAVINVQGALSGIFVALANVNEGALFFQRFTDLLAIPQPIHIPSTPQTIQPLVSCIEFKNVSYRYSDNHPWVLQNVNLKLPAGKCLALVGLNGAGKTTLAKLLSRLYDPTEGQILWDGVDLRNIDPIQLRSHIGVIFQDFVKFDMTAHDNIAIGDISRIGNENQEVQEAVIFAAKKSNIHNTIISLPKGYQTVLSRWLVNDEEGIDLSGGEWQKIALARMFMRKNADLFILDEPTAALDPQAELEIFSRFIKTSRGKTTILVSHRFSTVAIAEVIAVIEEGRIIEYGSHKQLLKKGGVYAKLYNIQAKQFRELESYEL